MTGELIQNLVVQPPKSWCVPTLRQNMIDLRCSLGIRVLRRRFNCPRKKAYLAYVVHGTCIPPQEHQFSFEQIVGRYPSTRLPWTRKVSRHRPCTWLYCAVDPRGISHKAIPASRAASMDSAMSLPRLTPRLFPGTVLHAPCSMLHAPCSISPYSRFKEADLITSFFANFGFPPYPKSTSFVVMNQLGFKIPSAFTFFSRSPAALLTASAATGTRVCTQDAFPYSPPLVALVHSCSRYPQPTLILCSRT